MDADDFIEALGRLEDGGDVEPLAALFADDAVLENPSSEAGRFVGRDGARRFWAEDRDLFGEVRSEFRNVIEGDGRAALEWTRQGTRDGGEEVSLSGVSLLELRDDRIARFAAYFDTRELPRELG